MLDAVVCHGSGVKEEAGRGQSSPDPPSVETPPTRGRCGAGPAVPIGSGAGREVVGRSSTAPPPVEAALTTGRSGKERAAALPCSEEECHRGEGGRPHLRSSEAGEGRREGDDHRGEGRWIEGEKHTERERERKRWGKRRENGEKRKGEKEKKREKGLLFN